MKQTVRGFTSRVSTGLGPDRVTEHQARLLPLCVCKQSSGPLTSPTINNTFLLRPIRPLFFPTTLVQWWHMRERHTKMAWPLSSTWLSKVKTTHRKSLNVISKGRKERIVQIRQNRLVDCHDIQVTEDLLETERKLKRDGKGRARKRQASSNDHVLTTCTECVMVQREVSWIKCIHVQHTHGTSTHTHTQSWFGKYVSILAPYCTAGLGLLIEIKKSKQTQC